jgi:hypothetical protein
MRQLEVFSGKLLGISTISTSLNLLNRYASIQLFQKLRVDTDQYSLAI